ncbi:MAG: relaxase domain-containing protein, partial [Xanthomonadales bacterium]|nr:relaxase domain-containing protein [Xanthomonadales bacterium]
MLSASKLQTAQDADQYYSEIDDYRRESDSAPTRWMGQGAARMGLSGDVQREDFVPLLQGHMPNGQHLQRATAGGSQHAPGWDFTFSAPKSVSVAALVGNDDRLISAHDRAVESAIGYLEQYGATTRVRTADKGIDEVDTGNLTVATYRHTTSRKTDPQLHTHAVVLNATNDRERWRSIDSRALYRIKSEVADVYRAELGRQARELGYQVEHDADANAGRTGFRLAEVPKELERDFSQRSQDIEAALGERGKDRESASRAEKQTATLATRDRKQAHEPGALRARWEATASERGVQTGGLVGRGSPYTEGQSAATASLQEAIVHLSERETRFSERELEITALRFGEGRASRSEIQTAIDDQVKARALVGARTWSYDPRAGRNNQVDGYTTRQGQHLERRMLDLSRMNPKIAPLADSAGFEEIAAHTESSSGYAWNPSQRAAAHGVITGDHRVSLIQGYAGTAKTTSVIAATAKAADAAEKEFVALAATHTAKDQITKATGKPSSTVAAFLAARPPGADANQRRVYVVDEASLISTRDMTKLLERTRGAQVLLVGDEKQIGSVQAGAAFRQLQESNRIPVYRLDQVVRQRNEELKSAVYDAADRKPADALRKVKVEEIRADPTADGYEGMSA